MSTHKQLVLVILALVACVVGAVYVRHEPAALPPAPYVPAVVAITTVATTSVAAVPAPTKSTNAVLVVDGRMYPVAVVKNETLIEAMRALATAGELVLTGREYPGMGFFVESINGKTNEGGMYWVFYVNGVSATEGVSTFTLKPGDRIEWRYEKGY